MASQATLQAPAGSNPNTHVGDEGVENIPPPGVSPTTGTFRSKVAVQEGAGLPGSCSQLDMGTPSRESRSSYPVLDRCHFSTPVLYSGNSGVSIPRSILTPIFKSLNLGMRSATGQSQRPLNNRDDADMNTSYLYRTITADCHKLMGLLSGSALTPVRAASRMDPSEFVLEDETLPNCSGMSLDVSVDSHSLLTAATNSTVTLGSPCISPQTPVYLKEMASKPEEDVNLNSDSEMSSTLSLNSEASSVLSVMGKIVSMNGSSCLRPSLDDTRDIATVDASLNGTQDISAGDIGLKDSRPSLELTGQNVAEMAVSDVIKIQSSGAPDGNVTCDISSSSDKSDQCTTLQSFTSGVERDGKLMNDTFELRAEPVESSKPEEPKSTVLPKLDVATTRELPLPSLSAVSSVNSTFDLQNRSQLSIPTNGDVAAQTACPQNNTFDLLPSNLSNMTTETTYDVQANSSESSTFDLPPSNLSKMTIETEANLKTNHCQNNTFALTQSNLCNVTTETKADVQTISSESNTFALPPSNLSKTTKETEAGVDTNRSQTNNSESCLALSQLCSAAGAVASCVYPQNNTFDVHPLQKLNGTTTLAKASTVAANLQNNTFETKPLNGTNSLSEIGSSDSPQNKALDMHSLPKPSNPATTPKDSAFEACPPTSSKVNALPAEAEATVKTVDLHNNTFEANPVVVAINSQSSLPVVDASSDSSCHQSMDLENDKVEAFNLDATLELRPDSFVTSTPMPDSNVFNLNAERQTGRTIRVNKRLYGEPPTKSVAQATAPSIVGDRKTFLKVPGAKSLLPPSQAVSQLLKHKPASAIPASSGLPMTRRRAQDEALRTPAASSALSQEATAVPTFSSSRSSIPGSKLPPPGMSKPQASGIPSGTLRSIQTLRPPSTRSNSVAASNATGSKLPPPGMSKPQASGIPSGTLRSIQTLRPPSTRSNSAAASNATGGAKSMVRTPQKLSKTKKHLLTSTEFLPSAKRKKMDAPVPSTSAEALTTSVEAARGARGPKQSAACRTAGPATNRSHGCANCALIQQELDKCQQEMRRLQEEMVQLRKSGHKRKDT